MDIIFDPKKDKANVAKHGISFNDIALFEWEVVITTPDNRFEYGESRFVTYGFVGKRLYALIWTKRDGYVRPISFRKANKRERRFYDKEIQS